MEILEKPIEINEKSTILGTLGARGWLGDALGRIWNGLGTPSWAVLAAKLAVWGVQLAVRGAKLALLGCFWPLVERVASANAFPSTVRSEFSSDVGTIAASPKLEIRAPTQRFVRVEL